MNGVAESLLQDILTQAQITNSHLANLIRTSASSGSSSGGGLSGLAGAATRVVPGLNLLSKAAGLVSGAFSMVSNVAGTLFNVISDTSKRLFDFAKAAAEGKAALSDLYNVFSNLPLIGKVFGLFGEFVRYQEDLLRVYQDLSKSGASFSGNLFEMRQAAFGAYMTMGEFSKVVKENSSVFATAIGGVDQGAKFFAASQKQLVDPNSPLGKSVAGLGLTFAEAGDMLGLFMSMQGNMNRLNQMGTRAVAESTGGLIKQLDAYAKLTGESREAQARALREQAFDEQRKAFLSKLSGAELAQANFSLAKAMEIGGKGLQDEVAVRLMSNGLIRVAGTEAANMLRMTTNNAADGVADVLASLKNLKPGSAEAVDALINARRMLGLSTKEFMDMIGGPGMAGTLSFFGALQLSAQQAKTYNQTLKDIEGRQLTAEEEREAIFEEQKKTYESNAAALQAAQLQIKMFGAALGTSFLQLIGKLSGPIQKISDFILKTFGEAVTELTKKDGPMDKLGVLLEGFLDVVTNVVTWFKELIIELSKAKGPGDVWNILYNRTASALQEMWDRIGPTVQSHFETLLGRMWQGLKDFLTGGPAKRLADLDDTIAKMRFAAMKGAKDEEEAELALRDFENSLTYKRMMKNRQEMLEQIEQREANYDTERRRRELQLLEIRDRRRAAEGLPVLPRHSGTLGMTGNWWEKSDTTVRIQAGETVATQAQIAQIVDSASQKGSPEILIALNSTMRALLVTMQKIEQNTSDSVSAIKNLDGDAFQLV